MITLKNFKILLCLLCFACLVCIGCKKPTPETAEQDAPFKPKGDLSDLVYNPIKADGTIDSSFLPIIVFEETEFDFGTINEGDVVTHKYNFKNTGTARLLITEVNSTCGCTTP